MRIREGWEKGLGRIPNHIRADRVCIAQTGQSADRESKADSEAQLRVPRSWNPDPITALLATVAMAAAAPAAATGDRREQRTRFRGTLLGDQEVPAVHTAGAPSTPAAVAPTWLSASTWRASARR